VLVNGTDVGPVSQFIFQNVTGDARIEVEFELTGSPFVDVSENNWFYSAVMYTFETGILRGTSDTHFSPQATTTRGMFVTILARMAGVRAEDWAFPGEVTGSLVNIRSGPGVNHGTIAQIPRGSTVNIIGRSGDWYRIFHNGRSAYISRPLVEAQQGTFSDVRPGAFYASYAEWANARGITTGTGGGRFSPGRTMTRQEMATLLYRYITVENISLQQNSAIPPFTDLNTVADWARPAVTALQRAGIIQGMPGGGFSPLGYSNRASVASMIMNFHQTYG